MGSPFLEEILMSATEFAIETATPTTPGKPRRAGLDALLSRQSHWPLAGPAPTDAELNQVFDTAMCAPDHGRLRPWRFVIVRDEAREDLADVLAELSAKRYPDAPAQQHEDRRQVAFAAPLLIVLAASISTESRIPESEQMLAVGASAMNVLNSLHMLGYGAFWATGADSHDRGMHDALDFESNERILGFLFVGTPPESAEPTPRPDRRDHVREWLGRSSI